MTTHFGSKLGIAGKLGVAVAAVTVAGTGCVACGGSGGDSTEATTSNVQELDENGRVGPFADEPDDIPLADGERDVNAETIAGTTTLDDAREENEARAEFDAPDAPPAPLTTDSAHPAPACKKTITATFAVYTYLSPDLHSNGCWTDERTVQDHSFRDCHSDGSIKYPAGDKWFYDDTNPYNAFGSEAKDVKACARDTTYGYEYMAYRESFWRIVGAKHLRAYFAELYTDDNHIDDLYYVDGIYRHNTHLAKHHRVEPMINFGVPLSTHTPHEIGVETLKICKRIRNHGHLGLYGAWRHPMNDQNPALTAVEHALNKCTAK